MGMTPALDTVKAQVSINILKIVSKFIFFFVQHKRPILKSFNQSEKEKLLNILLNLIGKIQMFL